jgi:hypothetical protein
VIALDDNINDGARSSSAVVEATPPGEHPPHSREAQELERLLGWVGSRLEDSEGRLVGTIEAVFVDRRTGTAQWLLVARDRLLVPIAGARAGSGRVSIPYLRSRVQSGPRPVTMSFLTAPTERALCEHYQRPPTRGARLSTWERRATSSRAYLVTGRANWLNTLRWEPGPRPAGADRRTGRDRRVAPRGPVGERRRAS